MRAILGVSGPDASDERSFIDVETTEPEPRPGDVIVEVHAVSVNPVDRKTRQRAPEGETTQLGYDASGVVVAVGPEAPGFSVGDPVWYAGDNTRPGSFAERQAVDARLVSLKPASLDDAQAAAMPLTFLTAYEGLFERLAIPEGATGTLLLVGGAGGVGTAVLQLLGALRPDVRVVATAGRPESVAWVGGLGAHAVDYRGDLVANVLAAAPEGIDWVFSSQTADRIAAFAELVHPFGAILAIDDVTGQDATVLKRKSIALVWESMFTRSTFQTPDMGRQGEILAEVAALVDDGRLTSPVAEVFRPFTAASVRAASALVDEGSMIGKAVVAR